MKLMRSLALVLGIVLPAIAGIAKTEIHGEDWDLSKPMGGISFQRVKAMTDATPDQTSLRYSHLRHINGRSQGRKLSPISALSRATQAKPFKTSPSYQNMSTVGILSALYAIQCAWDGKPTWLVFDTGSSDTWAAKEGFKCEDTSGIGYRPEFCAFGKPYIDDFTDGEIPGMHFSVHYGSANKTYWRGDNITVGILGLAYPSITSAYYGEIGGENSWNAVPYSPFFTNAVAQGTIDPLFSLALSRNSTGGILAWGGLPPVPLNMDVSAKTDLIVANLVDVDNTAWQYSYYTIVPDGVSWGLTTDTTKYPYIVDSGTSMMYLPPPLAEAVAMAFQPRAVFLYQYGTYFAPCDAIAPRFAIVISGTQFWVNPTDMIIKGYVDPLTGYCAVAVASGEDGPYILGAAFLKSVLAVFDVGAAEMRFYARE